MTVRDVKCRMQQGKRGNSFPAGKIRISVSTSLSYRYIGRGVWGKGVLSRGSEGGDDFLRMVSVLAWVVEVSCRWGFVCGPRRGLKYFSITQ